MSLQCNVTLNYSAYAAGQNPAPMATVTCYNPNASAVVVTGINITGHTFQSAIQGQLPMLQSSPPIGPGMTTSVPALSSITFGPFPIVIGSAANSNQFQMVNQTGNLFPQNPQGSQPSQTRVMVGATIQASDGSVNVAGEVGLLVSYYSPPPVGYQGGFLQFNGVNNLVLGFASGVL